MKRTIVSSLILLAVFAVFVQCTGTKASDNLNNKNGELKQQQIQDTTKQETKQHKADNASNNKSTELSTQSVQDKDKQKKQTTQDREKQIEQLALDTIKLNTRIERLILDTSKLNVRIQKMVDDSVKLNARIKRMVDDSVKLNTRIKRMVDDSIKINTQIVQLNQEKEQNQKMFQDKDTQIQKIINSYKNKSFDELTEFSNKFSVQQAKRLVDKNTNEEKILNDLEIYFEAEELLTKKFDPTKINSVLGKLNQIKQQSSKLKTVINKLKEYKDFYDEFKETIKKITDLDNRMIAAGASKAQENKYKEVLSILGNYIYNNSDYINYPYLSDIILEIIKRKYHNADDSIKDLLQKL